MGCQSKQKTIKQNKKKKEHEQKVDIQVNTGYNIYIVNASSAELTLKPGTVLAGFGPGSFAQKSQAERVDDSSKLGLFALNDSRVMWFVLGSTRCLRT